MKKVTSMTVLTTAEGKRLSITYSELDNKGNINSENNRINRVVVDSSVLEHIVGLETFAQSVIDEI